MPWLIRTLLLRYGLRFVRNFFARRRGVGTRGYGGYGTGGPGGSVGGSPHRVRSWRGPGAPYGGSPYGDVPPTRRRFFRR